MDLLTTWEDWAAVETLPAIIYGGNNASHNDEFDSRNKFVELRACKDFPPVFHVRSLCGKYNLYRAFPLAYRPATKLEIERLTNENFND